jgi:hypothetical protein
MKNLRLALGLVLLAIAFPIACFVALRRGWRRSLANARHLRAYETATRPLHGRR